MQGQVHSVADAALAPGFATRSARPAHVIRPNIIRFGCIRHP